MPGFGNPATGFSSIEQLGKYQSRYDFDIATLLSSCIAHFQPDFTPNNSPLENHKD